MTIATDSIDNIAVTVGGPPPFNNTVGDLIGVGVVGSWPNWMGVVLTAKFQYYRNY